MNVHKVADLALRDEVPLKPVQAGKHTGAVLSLAGLEILEQGVGMKIWVIEQVGYEGLDDYKVFSTEENAKAYMAADVDEYSYWNDPREVEVDAGLPDMTGFEVGGVFTSLVNLITGEIQRSALEGAPRHPERCVVSPKGWAQVVVRSPIGPEHADGVAMEIRLRKLAEDSSLSNAARDHEEKLAEKARVDSLTPKLNEFWNEVVQEFVRRGMTVRWSRDRMNRPDRPFGAFDVEGDPFETTTVEVDWYAPDDIRINFQGDRAAYSTNAEAIDDIKERHGFS